VIVASGLEGRRRRGITFGQVSDGASNTNMLIDADPEHATPWTKPTKFEPTAEFIQKLAGQDSIVAMAGGSVLNVKQDSIPVEVWTALTTKAGGKIMLRDWRPKQ